ncbi:type II toxin-antitoxin system VapC family toxin [Limnohabitans sp.]|jgi:predicted nucleic acid-binding protein|uniref:type II toxin-antitoxin system VapC family toxin n=1 Tax=Limnohabitans sp. TaxID=1907725 RepID=UPI0037C170B6
MILVDTNVFVDVIHLDPIWLDWSLRELSKAKNQQIMTNFVVYAELHTHNTAGPHIDEFLQKLGVQVLDLTRPAAQLAANAFRSYRQRGGIKTGVLPDFFIGAHAVVENCQLLTRDAGRYRSYFPDIDLICP